MAKRFPIFKDESGVSGSASVSVFDETTTPANAANQAKIYSKDVAGVSKMHALDSDGTEIELGTGAGGSSLVTAPGPQHSNTDLTPIVQYTLNGVLTDGSGNGHDLTVSTGTEKYSGQNHVPGDQSSLLGGADRLTGGTIAALQLTGEVTVMLWCMPQDTDAQQTLVTYDASGTDSDSANNTLWDVTLLANGVVRYFHEAGAGTNYSHSTAEGVVPPGSKSHITLTRASDGVSINIYVNGAFVSSATLASAPTGGGNSALNIGSIASDTLFFNGSLWDLAVYDQELTATQVKEEYQRQVGQSPVVRFGRALHGLDHSPLGLYQLNGDGTDASGNGKDLTDTGTPAYVAGYVGSTYDARASSSAFTRADSSFALTGAISVYALIRLESYSTFRTIANYSDSGETEATNALWWLYVDSSGFLAAQHEYGGGLDEIVTSSVEIPTNTWVWVGFTRDAAGTDVSVFINGEEDTNTVVANAATGGTTSDLYIGRIASGTATSSFDGQIQSVKIVDSELTPAEMRAEYERCFGVGDGTGIAHQDKHLSGGSDEIDGDQLDIDWNPSNYTPDIAPAEVTSVDHLTAHLAGIDTALASAGGSSLVTAPGPQHSDTTSLSPVVQYTLNEVLTDGSGNGHDLSVGTGTEDYAGQNHVPGDAAFRFNGSSRLAGGSIPALALTGEMSILFWCVPESTTPSYSFVAGYTGPGETSADNALWTVYVRASGALEFFQESGGGTNTAVTSATGLLQVGAKNFVALTRDSAGTGVNIYVNGILAHSGTLGSAPDGGGSSVFHVGAFADDSEDYTGSLWDLMVLDTELSAAQIKAEYQRQVGQSPVLKIGRALHDNTHSPLGLWQLQGDGTDASGNGRDLSNNLGTPDYGDGWVGTSFAQNSTDSLVNTDNAFALTGAVSVYALCKLEDASDGTYTLLNHSGSVSSDEDLNSLYSVLLTTTSGLTTLRYFAEYGPGNNIDFSAANVAIGVNEWVWVGFTRDSAGTGVKLFVNGAVVDSSTLTAPSGGTLGDLYVGANDNGSNPFTGKIQSLKIVGSELTEAEMRAEYERCFGVGDGTGIAHQALHLSGGKDEIDGDQIDIDWNPSNYTPTTAPTEVTSAEHLTAHLAGVDTTLALLSGYFDTTVQTTDATVTTIHTIATTTNQCTYVEVTVQARDNTANETAFYKKFAAFDNAAGTVTQQGSTTSIITDIEDDATWDVTLTVSGTDILVRVTGDATNAVEWRAFGFTKTHG